MGLLIALILPAYALRTGILQPCRMQDEKFDSGKQRTAYKLHRNSLFQQVIIKKGLLQEIIIYRISCVCLKNHFRNLHSPVCGEFIPDLISIARYAL